LDIRLFHSRRYIKPVREKFRLARKEIGKKRLDRKVLVLEDYQWKRCCYEKFGKGHFDCPETIGRWDGINRYEEIKDRLQKIPYRAILIDDFMDEIDEGKLVGDLISGKLKSINRHTPVYSISCMFVGEDRLPHYEGVLSKPSGDEEDGKEIVERTIKHFLCSFLRKRKSSTRFHLF
jgi:hypothetical protein